MNTANCKRPGWFRCASFGDVHLGHPNTPTATIITNLLQYINEDMVSELDMLIIEGDLFDRLLTNADDNVYRIQSWATILMLWCAKHNTLLEILEGTPSHDWFQSKFFVEQKHNAKIPVDLHYAKGLTVRHIEKFDMWMLYVPDHCLPHPDDILTEARLQMAKHGITQVDFAVMHGAFRYQYPDVVLEPTHDEATYLEMVKYFIFIGHVHQSTQYERILAAGSFDRLGHGDEGHKGFYDVSVREDGTHRITFIVNHHAKRYDTIEVHGLDVKAINAKLHAKMAELKRGSAIRLRYYKGDAAADYIDVLKKEYPDYNWSDIRDDTEKKRKASIVDLNAVSLRLNSFAPINDKSLLELLRPELERHTSDPARVERCLKHAETILEV